MTSTTSTAAAKTSQTDSLTIGLLTAGTLFVVGYTLVRALLFQPALQSEDVVINSVIPHEATLWNADFDSF